MAGIVKLSNRYRAARDRGGPQNRTSRALDEPELGRLRGSPGVLFRRIDNVDTVEYTSYIGKDTAA
jgi:hypothetical protein